MAEVRFTCAHCRADLKTAVENAGKAGECPVCRRSILIPDAPLAAPHENGTGREGREQDAGGRVSEGGEAINVKNRTLQPEQKGQGNQVSGPRARIIARRVPGNPFYRLGRPPEILRDESRDGETHRDRGKDEWGESPGISFQNSIREHFSAPKTEWPGTPKKRNGADDALPQHDGRMEGDGGAMAYRECGTCGTKIPANEKQCKYCGAYANDYPYGGPAPRESGYLPMPSLPRASSSAYRAARVMARVTTAAGWVLCAVGAAGIVAAFVSEGGWPGQVAFPLSAGTCVAGILVAAGGQLQRAVVDVADHCSEMRRLLKGMYAGQGSSGKTRYRD